MVLRLRQHNIGYTADASQADYLVISDCCSSCFPDIGL